MKITIEKKTLGFWSLLVIGLTIAFTVLKLCGVINWSWFWVLFPIILDLCISLIFIIGFIIFYLITNWRN